MGICARGYVQHSDLCLNLCVLTICDPFLLSGEFLNDLAEFRSFDRSMLLLVRMATGENWNGVMHDCKNESFPPGKECVLNIVRVSFSPRYGAASLLLKGTDNGQRRQLRQLHVQP